jgi:hypothetical protein
LEHRGQPLTVSPDLRRQVGAGVHAAAHLLSATIMSVVGSNWAEIRSRLER